jgi:hypothetical protein
MKTPKTTAKPGDLRGQIDAKRAEREAANLQIEQLKLRARALTAEINAMEGQLPRPVLTGHVTRITTK